MVSELWKASFSTSYAPPSKKPRRRQSSDLGDAVQHFGELICDCLSGRPVHQGEYQHDPSQQRHMRRSIEHGRLVEEYEATLDWWGNATNGAPRFIRICQLASPVFDDSPRIAWHRIDGPGNRWYPHHAGPATRLRVPPGVGFFALRGEL